MQNKSFFPELQSKTDKNPEISKKRLKSSSSNFLQL